MKWGRLKANPKTSLNVRAWGTECSVVEEGSWTSERWWKIRNRNQELHEESNGTGERRDDDFRIVFDML